MKTYLIPEISVVELDANDIIVTSGLDGIAKSMDLGNAISLGWDDLQG